MDVKLCSIYSEEEKKKVEKILLIKNISFSIQWKKLSVLNRGKSHGQKWAYTVYVSSLQEEEARKELGGIIKSDKTSF